MKATRYTVKGVCEFIFNLYVHNSTSTLVLITQEQQHTKVSQFWRAKRDALRLLAVGR